MLSTNSDCLYLVESVVIDPRVPHAVDFELGMADDDAA